MLFWEESWLILNNKDWFYAEKKKKPSNFAV